MDSSIVHLLRSIGSPFITDNNIAKVRYYTKDYSKARANKIPLTYLSKVSTDTRQGLAEYHYHSHRLSRLLEITANISRLFNEEGLKYVVFKTLRPFPEYVSDIDVLGIGAQSNYAKIKKILVRNNFLFMEKGAYCTTFKDFKTNFATEVMIDVYDEISVNRLIYLDKRTLNECIINRQLSADNLTKVFDAEAELLVTIAHSGIKENRYILAEYYATLCYLSEMNEASINSFVNLVRANKLVNVVRWHLSITAMLHQAAYGVMPKKLVNLLSNLGGFWNISWEIINCASPPYNIAPLTLALIMREKLGEKLFKRSFLSQLAVPINDRASMHRIIERFNAIK